MVKKRTAKRKVETFNKIVLLARELDKKVRSINKSNEIVISIGIINLDKRDWEYFNPNIINLNHKTMGLNKENIRVRELLNKIKEMENENQ